LSEKLSYEDALRRAHAEGWRDPVAVSVLEIKAYEAGMRVERQRVLSIFEDLSDAPFMRMLDMEKYLIKVRNP